MRNKRWLVWIALAGFGLRLAAWWYFRNHAMQLVAYQLPDDALYYFAIARNIAHGFGISFDSVHPTNGMHPLWLFLISPIFLFSLTKWGFIHAVLLFQSALDAAIVWLIGGTTYDLLPDAKESNRMTAAASAALIYAFSIIAVIRSINGLETTITSLLFILWLRAYLRTSISNKGSWALFGVVTGLLLLARTDSFIVLIPIAIYSIATRGRTEWKGMLTALLLACCAVLPWLIWSMANFGTIMQSSAEAVPMLAMRKYQALYGSFFLNYWHLLFEAARNMLKPFWYAAFGLPLLTIGSALISRRKWLSSTERSLYMMLLGGVFLLIIHSLFRGFIRDWYVEELIPIFLIGFGVSIGSNIGSAESRPRGRYILAGVIIILQIFAYRTPQYPSQSAILESGLPTTERLTENAKVASFNSGYYGYFASRPGSVVNIDGVVNSDALLALKNGHIGAYLERDSVSYILDFRGDFGGYINLFDRRLLDAFVLDSVITNRNSIDDPIVLYRRKDIPGHKEVPYTE